MATFEAGDVLYCTDCDLVVTVDRACNCEGDCVLACCGKPLVRRESGAPARPAGSGCCGCD